MSKENWWRLEQQQQQHKQQNHYPVQPICGNRYDYLSGLLELEGERERSLRNSVSIFAPQNTLTHTKSTDKHTLSECVCAWLFTTKMQKRCEFTKLSKTKQNCFSMSRWNQNLCKLSKQNRKYENQTKPCQVTIFRERCVEI